MIVGFIGLGMMGRGMAGCIQRAGHTLVLNDIAREQAADLLAAGARWADTPRELAHSCDVVFTSLPTPAVVEQVAFGKDGLAEGFLPSATWFDLSTNSVSVVRRIHARLTEQGVNFLDAPVSGGPGGAAAGKLAILVGGDQEAFDTYRPILDAMGDQPRHVGPIGAGTIVKLVHNVASIAMVAVTTEVMTMGVKAGMEPLALWQAIRTGVAGRLRSFDNIGKRFLPGRLDPAAFALRLAYKDMSLGLDLGKECEVPMRLCNLVLQDMMEALNRGWDNRDAHSFLLLQQERAGIPPFKLSEEDISRVLAGT